MVSIRQFSYSRAWSSNKNSGGLYTQDKDSSTKGGMTIPHIAAKQRGGWNHSIFCSCTLHRRFVSGLFSSIETMIENSLKKRSSSHGCGSDTRLLSYTYVYIYIHMETPHVNTCMCIYIYISMCNFPGGPFLAERLPRGAFSLHNGSLVISKNQPKLVWLKT